MYKLLTELEEAIELAELVEGAVYQFGTLYRVYQVDPKNGLNPIWLSASNIKKMI